MTVSYHTTRPSTGPLYTTTVDAALIFGAPGRTRACDTPSSSSSAVARCPARRREPNRCGRAVARGGLRPAMWRRGECAGLGRNTQAGVGTSAHDGGLAEAPPCFMTRKSLRPRPGRPSWLTAGVLTVSLGIVALVASAPLTLLRDAGWPWTSTMSVQASPAAAKATIVENDGTVHEFTGTPSDTETWLVNKEHELKTAHGIYTKIAVGQALNRVGWVLLILGCVVLLWRSLAVRPRRRFPGPPASRIEAIASRLSRGWRPRSSAWSSRT